MRFLSLKKDADFFSQRFLIYETQKPLAVGRIQPESVLPKKFYHLGAGYTLQ
jgi:hypothetical protein